MFETKDGGFRPVDVNDEEFSFRVGDTIETIPTGREIGRYNKLLFVMGIIGMISQTAQ